MKKRFLLLLIAFISLNGLAQEKYFSGKVQFGVTPIANSTDHVMTLDAQGYLNKSTITVQQLTDGIAPTGASNGLSLNGLNVELGGTLTKDTSIDLGSKVFTIIGSGNLGIDVAGASISSENLLNLSSDANVDVVAGSNLNLSSNNTINITAPSTYISGDIQAPGIAEDLIANRVVVMTAGDVLKTVPKSNLEQDLSNYFNLTTPNIVTDITTFAGFGDIIKVFNLAGTTGIESINDNGIANDIINKTSGVGIKMTNELASTANSFVITKGGAGEVFKIDNVGKLTLGAVDEDLAVVDILGRNGADEVVKIPASTITAGFLPLDGSSKMSGALEIPLIGKALVIGGDNVSDDDDVSIYFGTNVILGWDIKYMGSGSGANNSLAFVGGGAGGGETTALEMFQDGNITVEKTLTSNTGFKVGTNEVYHEGNLAFNQWCLYGNLSLTPQVIPANTETVLTNDGGYFNSNNKITTLYNTSTNQVDLSEASVGDSFNMVMELDITTSSANQVVTLRYTGAIGTVDEWSINITNEVYYKTQGARHMVANFNVPLEFAGDITNPGEISIVSDGALNVVTKYHSLKIN